MCNRLYYTPGERRAHCTPQETALSRDDLIEMEGKVTNVLVGGNFEITTTEGHKVLASLSGRMRRFRIRVVLGDDVTVGVSPYDPTRGLITRRTQ